MNLIPYGQAATINRMIFRHPATGELVEPNFEQGDATVRIGDTAHRCNTTNLPVPDVLPKEFKLQLTETETMGNVISVACLDKTDPPAFMLSMTVLYTIGHPDAFYPEWPLSLAPQE